MGKSTHSPLCPPSTCKYCLIATDRVMSILSRGMNMPCEAYENVLLISSLIIRDVTLQLCCLI